MLAYDLIVSKFSDIENIIIPLFEKYPIQGTKQLDYLNFCKIAIINEWKKTSNNWRFEWN